MSAEKGNRTDETPLRLAIVTLAISDYMSALKAIKKCMGKHLDMVSCSEIVKDEVESFLRGAWYEMLCDIEGEVVIEMARKKAKWDEAEYQRWRTQRDAAIRAEQEEQVLFATKCGTDGA